MVNPNQDARDGRGKYTRTLEGAEKDAAAADLRSKGYTYQRIADELGYSDKKNAWTSVQRCLKAVIEEPTKEVLALELGRLDAELERLNGLEDSVRAVLERKHITVSNGRIIKLPNPDTGDEEPLEDDGPVLQAVDRLLRIEESRRKNGESRRKLLGLDAPAKTQVSGGVTFEIVGVDLDQLR